MTLRGSDSSSSSSSSDEGVAAVPRAFEELLLAAVEVDQAVQRSGEVEDWFPALARLHAALDAGAAPGIRSLAPPALTRYDLVTNGQHYYTIQEMEPADLGDWVRYEDIEPLLASPSLPSPAWQAIETAPKDGSSILGYQRGWCINGGEVNITRWQSTWDRWGIASADWEPTHWMPLPAAPSLAPRRQEEEEKNE